jgi:chromatin assembly factor 1 subunit A
LFPHGHTTRILRNLDTELTDYRSSETLGCRHSGLFDYGYDSGEEWEEESVVGEEVEDDGKDEDGDAEDADSDLDSWLVDDDEEPDAALVDHRNSSPPPFLDFPNASPPKRKAEDTERKIGKKRKVVIPLVPFAKGTVWESTIGVCQYEPFKPYAIQLFNGQPCLFMNLVLFHALTISHRYAALHRSFYICFFMH